MSDNPYTDDQLEFFHKLEELAGYAGREADDDARNLLAEIQDEFENMKRAFAREDEDQDSRLLVGDINGFAAGIEDEFPRAADGCRVFVSVWAQEQRESAPRN